MLISFDVPEAFIQLEIKKGKKGKPLAIQNGLYFEAAEILGYCKKKIAVNTTFTIELNDAVKKSGNLTQNWINSMMKMVYLKMIDLS